MSQIASPHSSSRHSVALLATVLALVATAVAAPAASAHPSYAGPNPDEATQVAVVHAGPNPDEAVAPSQPTQLAVVHAGPNPDEAVPISQPTGVHLGPGKPDPGFDWADAGIGAAFALAVIGFGGTLAIVGRRRRDYRQASAA